MGYPLKRHLQYVRTSEGYVKTNCGLVLKNIADVLSKCDPNNYLCEKCEAVDNDFCCYCHPHSNCAVLSEATV